MDDEPAYILDVRGLKDEGLELQQQPPRGRKWIGVRFECCGVYTRIYRNQEGSAYEGCCPRCTRQVRVRIGPGGTHHRMFRAR